MKRLTRSKRLKLSITTSIFLLLSIPIVLYGLLLTEDVDPRSDAGTDVPTSFCSISFPYVESDTVEAGKVVQLTINGSSPNEVSLIDGIKIETSEDIVLLEKSYPQPQSTISETITFSSENVGNIRIFGQMTTLGANYPCILEGSNESGIVTTKEINSAPEFTSIPETDAQPSNAIKVGDSYEYTLTAQDIDGDGIEFAYSFTPRADWLTMSVIKAGSDGVLTLLFKGTTDQPASYLANVFIHDGYNQHLRAQTWVISVDPAENDTPIVTVTAPPVGSSVTQGQNITASWSATDLNQILRYRLYYASNPGNQNSWKPVDENISYKIGSYIVDTKSIEPGDYKFIIEAEDNQAPPAIGTGVSESFTIIALPPVVVDDGIPPTDDEKPPPPPPDDGVVIQEAQIVNVNPADSSVINNARRTISATLVASKEASIVIESIVMKLDSQDITDQLEISEISDSEVTVIYKPQNDLEDGEHKVEISFEDSEGGRSTKKWTFTMESLDEDSTDSINILGFDISNRTAWIILIGLGIIILALIIPWILYLAWRDDGDDETNIYDIRPTARYPYNTSPRASIPPTIDSSSNKKDAPKPVFVPTVTMPSSKKDDTVNKTIDTKTVSTNTQDTNTRAANTAMTSTVTKPSAETSESTTKVVGKGIDEIETETTSKDVTSTSTEIPKEKIPYPTLEDEASNKRSKFGLLKNILPTGKGNSTVDNTTPILDPNGLRNTSNEDTQAQTIDPNVVSQKPTVQQDLVTDESVQKSRFKPMLKFTNSRNRKGDQDKTDSSKNDTAATDKTSTGDGTVDGMIANSTSDPENSTAPLMWKPKVIVPPRREADSGTNPKDEPKPESPSEPSVPTDISADTGSAPIFNTTSNSTLEPETKSNVVTTEQQNPSATSPATPSTTPMDQMPPTSPVPIMTTPSDQTATTPPNQINITSSEPRFSLISDSEPSSTSTDPYSNDSDTDTTQLPPQSDEGSQIPDPNSSDSLTALLQQIEESKLLVEKEREEKQQAQNASDAGDLQIPTQPIEDTDQNAPAGGTMGQEENTPPRNDTNNSTPLTFSAPPPSVGAN